MTKIIEFPRIFKVRVQETRTRTYYVKADDELQAQERYLLEGMTSDLYDTDFDRMILSAELTKKLDDE